MAPLACSSWDLRSTGCHRRQSRRLRRCHSRGGQLLAERQPHRGDLLLLLDDDFLRDPAQSLIASVPQLRDPHVDCTLVVRDHPRGGVFIHVAPKADVHASHHLFHGDLVLGQERRLRAGCRRRRIGSDGYAESEMQRNRGGSPPPERKRELVTSIPYGHLDQLANPTTCVGQSAARAASGSTSAAPNIDLMKLRRLIHVTIRASGPRRTQAGRYHVTLRNVRVWDNGSGV